MSFSTFENQQYLNLETFRKNGQGVKTPVWFAQEGTALYVWTQANSGKAKRARNNPQVNIAPCKADGSLLGEWIAAQVQRDDAAEAIEFVSRLMVKKYGLAYQGFRLMGALQKTTYTTLKITAVSA